MPETIVERDNVGFIDSLTSYLSGLGDPTRDKAESTTFVDRIIGVAEVEAAFRNSWIVRKAVTIPAYDATRMWRRWEAEKDQIEKIEEVERRFNVPGKMCELLVAARNYGGAIIIVGTDQDMSKPLDLERVGSGSLKFLHVVPRTRVTSGQLISDVRDPWFGHPEYYESSVIPGSVRSARFHPSHVVRMIGNDLPDPMASADPWGDPVFQTIYDSARNAGIAPRALTQLLQEANVDVLKMPSLTKNFQTIEGTQKVSNYAGNMSTMRSVYRTLLIDSDMEWQRLQLNLAGVVDSLSILLQIVCAAVDVPAVRFLGQSAPGLNSTGDVDLRNYYDHVRSDQERKYSPAMATLDEVIIREALGERDPSVWYDWRSLWQLTEREKADINKVNAEAAKVYADTGLVQTAALAKAVQNQMIESGLYPGLETLIDEAEAAGDLVEDPDPIEEAKIAAKVNEINPPEPPPGQEQK